VGNWKILHVVRLLVYVGPIYNCFAFSAADRFLIPLTASSSFAFFCCMAGPLLLPLSFTQPKQLEKLLVGLVLPGREAAAAWLF
jgi:hypothetical protein